jgi:small subunit ribosomal protein S1
VSIDPRDLDAEDVNQNVEEALRAVSAEDLEAMMASPPSSPAPDERGRIRGRIIEVRGSEVLVDIGARCEAYVPLEEFDRDAAPLPGQERMFLIHGVDGQTGQMRLSLHETRHEADLEALHAGDVVEGRVTGVNLGGLELNVKGIRAFMPKSQVELSRVTDFTPYIGRRLECQISEVDRRNRTLVVSRRKLLEREREQARQELKYSLAEGQVRRGVVRRLTDFGAFVDLGGLEGLLHISDISHARLRHPSEVLKVNQPVDVQILKIDLVKDRISLGLKQLSPDPWELVATSYQPGSTVEGRVVRVLDFGAIVELEPGVEGLLPTSELSWTQRVRHPGEIVKEGDCVRVSVLAVDSEKRKLTLSLKALGADPWKDVAQRYQPDMVVSGRVTHVAEFGAFVQLEEGVEGLVHISELSDKRVKSVGEVVKPDQVIKVRIKSVDPEQRRISLSLRGTGEERPEERQKGEMRRKGAGPPEEPADAAAPRRIPPHRKRPLKGGLD